MYGDSMASNLGNFVFQVILDNDEAVEKIANALDELERIGKDSPWLGIEEHTNSMREAWCEITLKPKAEP